MLSRRKNLSYGYLWQWWWFWHRVQLLPVAVQGWDATTRLSCSWCWFPCAVQPLLRGKAALHRSSDSHWQQRDSGLTAIFVRAWPSQWLCLLWHSFLALICEVAVKPSLCISCLGRITSLHIVFSPGNSPFLCLWSWAWPVFLKGRGKLWSRPQCLSV